ncbi:hypothetical protein FB451DRAFT_1409463 [Mycena latifolia]|nr:hypothetical protein FB451DRAFT_1409463 [Mycena latifolia]
MSISPYGEIPLVTKVHNADMMATLLLVKPEFEASTSAALRITFAGATEAHLLAALIGAAGVSLILAPRARTPNPGTSAACTCSSFYASDSFCTQSSGPPLSQKAAVTTLLRHGVNLALSVRSEYAARTVIYARFELAWAALDADGATPTTNMDTAGEDLFVEFQAVISLLS